jgi:FkbH-like protein
MNRIAVLSNVTIELVLSELKKEFSLYIPAGFDTWQQEVYNHDSGLYQFAPDMICVILYIDAYDEDWMYWEKGKERMGEWLNALKTLCGQTEGTPVFISSLDIRENSWNTVSLGMSGICLEEYWIREVKKLDHTFVMPLKEIVAEWGRKDFYSSKLWYLGNAPYSMKGSRAVAELIRRSYFYVAGDRKKCLAVDLDNTLWGGVIGEDGVDSLILSNHKEGGRYYDVQKCLKRMKENGVMLVILSKNNPEDVAAVFSHPYMFLQEDDFVGQKINWNPKTQNIQELAEELNIGLDSFVFLDDNPVERELMKAQCPQVEVIEFPQDTTLLARTVEDAYDKFFKGLYITDEDRDKTVKYQRQWKRKEIQKEADSMEDYLRKLEIIAELNLMEEQDIKRVVQLAGKTNQFNTTTIRYDERHINLLRKSGDTDLIVAKMKDKFGDEGLTATVVLVYKNETAFIESFMMSCRVMSRQFEEVIFHEIVKWIRHTYPKIQKLQAEYRKTAKNKPVENLYESLGFQVKEEKGKESENGYQKIYEVDIKDIKPFHSPYKAVHAFH